MDPGVSPSGCSVSNDGFCPPTLGPRLSPVSGSGSRRCATTCRVSLRNTAQDLVFCPRWSITAPSALISGPSCPSTPGLFKKVAVLHLRSGYKEWRFTENSSLLFTVCVQETVFCCCYCCFSFVPLVWHHLLYSVFFYTTGRTFDPCVFTGTQFDDKTSHGLQ